MASSLPQSGIDAAVESLANQLAASARVSAPGPDVEMAAVGAPSALASAAKVEQQDQARALMFSGKPASMVQSFYDELAKCGLPGELIYYTRSENINDLSDLPRYCLAK